MFEQISHQFFSQAAIATAQTLEEVSRLEKVGNHHFFQQACTVVCMVTLRYSAGFGLCLSSSG
jgi:hypothetical protein